MSLLYTENGATENLPHHLQLQGQVPFTPVFTAEEAAISAAMVAPRETGSPAGDSKMAPAGNFLATMKFSVTTPVTLSTVKARLPQLQARRQLPFGGTAGTPKGKKPSSSTKKRAVSAGVSLAEDSSSSGEDPAASNGGASGKHKSSRKGTRDTLAVELDALKEQLKKVQMDLLNPALETMEVIASVKTDLMQLHNQVQPRDILGLIGTLYKKLEATEAFPEPSGLVTLTVSVADPNLVNLTSCGNKVNCLCRSNTLTKSDTVDKAAVRFCLGARTNFWGI
jgi:hypothetical protein